MKENYFFFIKHDIKEYQKRVDFWSIHPNHSYKRKFFYKKLAKKFKFNISNGGKIVEDLCNSEVCIGSAVWVYY